MKKFNDKLLLSIAVLGVVGMLLLASCGSDDSSSGPTGPGEGGYAPVYSADGGFVITHEMLDKRYNEITFPGTHNSYAGTEWAAHCENQDLTIAQQLGLVEKGLAILFSN